MPIDWGTAVPTAVGGAVSGFVGIVYSEYRTQREEKKSTAEWYRRTINFTKQVQLSIQKYQSDSEVTQLISTCEDLIPKIREHILKAPAELDDETEEIITNFRISCESIANMSALHSADGTQELPGPEQEIVNELSDHANKLKRCAKCSADDVGWL